MDHCQETMSLLTCLFKADSDKDHTLCHTLLVHQKRSFLKHLQLTHPHHYTFTVK